MPVFKHPQAEKSKNTLKQQLENVVDVGLQVH